MTGGTNTSLNKLVLFDIDGTLLRTNGAGMLSIKQGMLQIFGECGTIDTYVGGGRNYQQIVRDTLVNTAISGERITEEFPRFEIEVEKILKKLIEYNPGQIYPLPGGLELVERLYNLRDVVLGLVTGNPKECARIKLEAAGYIFNRFKFNSFGDETSSRTAQVDRARMNALNATGYSFAGVKTVIVGDTIHDIACSRDSGARCVIVSTGDSTHVDLLKAGPDFIFTSLKNIKSIEKAILG